MHVLTDLAAPQSAQNLHAFRGGMVTIGNFDGLHLGHRALLHAATGAPGPRVVLTFAPHPVQVLYPERGLKRLFPREDLRERLPELGVDVLIELPFTRAFAQLGADEFLKTYLEPLAPRALVAGYDFGFGNRREGTLDDLRRWCADRRVQFAVVEPLERDGAVVSSRRLRALIEAGDVAEAARLLGRPFYLRGRVGRGAGRGATIGIPTLNQVVVNETLPKTGVYATRARRGAETYDAVTNVGVTPTFAGAGEIKVETHVLDRDVHWREQVIDVDFVARLRDERKFDGIEALKAQIARDVLAARAALRI